MARVAQVWTSPAKNSGRMDARERVRAIEEHGLEGCAHARPGTKRQVLFASAQHLDELGVEYGRIRENFTVERTYGWFDYRPYRGGEDMVFLARRRN